jgi:hypothetical protein
LIDRNRPAIQLKYAEGYQHSVWGHVVIDSLQRLQRTCPTVPGEFADLDRRLGIERDPQRFGVGRCLGALLLDVFKDGVGFGNFFQDELSAPGGDGNPID